VVSDLGHTFIVIPSYDLLYFMFVQCCRVSISEWFNHLTLSNIHRSRPCFRYGSATLIGKCSQVCIMSTPVIVGLAVQTLIKCSRNGQTSLDHGHAYPT